MMFLYRGKYYTIIRSATYPESEYQQHQNAQDHIDTLLDKPQVIQQESSNALEEFFKLIEE